MTFNREELGAAKEAAAQARHHLSHLRHNYNEAADSVQLFKGQLNDGELERWKNDLNGLDHAIGIVIRVTRSLDEWGDMARMKERENAQ